MKKGKNLILCIQVIALIVTITSGSCVYSGNVPLCLEYEAPFEAIFSDDSIKITIYDDILPYLEYVTITNHDGTVLLDTVDKKPITLYDIEAWKLYRINIKAVFENYNMLYVTHLMLNETPQTLYLAETPTIALSSANVQQHYFSTNEQETNSTVLDAQELSDGKLMRGTMSSPDDVDMYHIVISSPGTTAIFLSDIMLGNDFDLTIYDYLGEQVIALSHNVNSRDEAIVLNTVIGEGYFIKVTRNSGANYDLSYSLFFTSLNIPII